MSTKKRTQYTPVSLGAVGLQLSYGQQARTVQQAQQELAPAGVVPPSKQTPRAWCPQCKGRWEILAGSPLLAWRRYRLRPETECPNYACRSSHMSLGWCVIADMHGTPQQQTLQQQVWTQYELHTYDVAVRSGEQVQRYLSPLVRQ